MKKESLQTLELNKTVITRLSGNQMRTIIGASGTYSGCLDYTDAPVTATEFCNPPSQTSGPCTEPNNII